MKCFNNKKYILLSFLLVLVHSVQAQDKIEDEGLNPKQESIVEIASYTAKGDLEALKGALNNGLDNELTVNEIKEVIVHLYAYSGFPRSIRGLQTFIAVLDERKAQGIEDTWGNEASPIKDSRDKYSRGQETLKELTNTPQDGPKPRYQQFSPAMDVFLKEHLFADIFERDVLTYAQRELVTISVLSTLGTLDPMLQSHMKISLNVGLTPGQLEEFTDIIQATAGEQEAQASKKVLEEVLKDRQK